MPRSRLRPRRTAAREAICTHLWLCGVGPPRPPRSSDRVKAPPIRIGPDGCPTHPGTSPPGTRTLIRISPLTLAEQLLLYADSCGGSRPSWVRIVSRSPGVRHSRVWHGGPPSRSPCQHWPVASAKRCPLRGLGHDNCDLKLQVTIFIDAQHRPLAAHLDLTLQADCGYDLT